MAKDAGASKSKLVDRIHRLQDENKALKLRIAALAASRKEADKHIKAAEKDIDEYDKLLITIEQNLYTEAERVSRWPN